QSMWQAGMVSPGAWKQRSARMPQSASELQLAQCIGECGMHRPFLSPGVIASQNQLTRPAQSFCAMHGITQIEPSPGTGARHSPEAQSLSCVQVSPGTLSGAMKSSGGARSGTARSNGPLGGVARSNAATPDRSWSLPFPLSAEAQPNATRYSSSPPYFMCGHYHDS